MAISSVVSASSLPSVSLSRRVGPSTNSEAMKFEAAESARAVDSAGRQRLQRNLAPQPWVLGQIDPAHSSGAQGREDPVVRHRGPFRERRRRLIGIEIARRRPQRLLNEFGAFHGRRPQQGFDLFPQAGIVSARRIQEMAALLRLQFQRLVK
jgi:hypothetical protein